MRTTSAGGHVALDVYSLNASCNTRYEGYVALDKPAVEIGLPAGKPTLLVFEFRRGQDAHSIKKEVQISPRAGNRYEANVAYKSAIYDIELREIDPRTGTDLELDTRRRC